MEPTGTVSPSSAPPRAFRWESPSKKTVVYLDFDVVDRLNFDVMKGFGAVPRRGAEVGGILLGTVETGETTVVRIEDAIAVACEYLRGPSYILSEADLGRFDEIASRYDDGGGAKTVVGYYRSNTRDTLEISAEDRALLDSRYPADGSVFLLIKPFATMIAQGAFTAREEGVFSEGEPDTFPFRRKEMGGGSGRPARPPRAPAAAEEPMPPRRSPVSPRISTTPPVVTQFEEEPPISPPRSVPAQLSLDEAAGDPPPELSGEPAPSRFRSGWIWIPLSFIFLLLGVVLGFQIAISFRTAKPVDALNDPYSMDLKAAKTGESLHLKWNPDAPAVLRAQRGVLAINDGDSTRSVELTKEDLARGSVLYRNVSNQIRFRLEVFPRESNAVSETLELKLPGEAPAESADPASAKTKKRRVK
jgi:hypothetical protein